MTDPTKNYCQHQNPWQYSFYRYIHPPLLFSALAFAVMFSKNTQNRQPAFVSLVVTLQIHE